jgi:hypothetical protein
MEMIQAVDWLLMYVTEFACAPRKEQYASLRTHARFAEME